MFTYEVLIEYEPSIQILEVIDRINFKVPGSIQVLSQTQNVPNLFRGRGPSLYTFKSDSMETINRLREYVEAIQKAYEQVALQTRPWWKFWA